MTAAEGGHPPLFRGEARRIALVAGVALLLRLLAFLVERSADPLFEQPILDGFYHDLLARRLVAGEGQGEAVFFRAPLYPWLLAGVYLIGGGSIALALLLQHLLGAATSVLVYLLARRHASPRVALAAGLAAAAYWPFLYFEGDLLIVTTIVFLDVLALLLLTLALERERLRLFAAGGLVLGLSAIARPSVLVFLPFLPLVLRGPPVFGGSRPAPWIRWTLCTWACALVPILPLTVRNLVVGHDLVLIAYQGGVNFYIGNNPQADGVTAIVPGTRGDWMGGFEDTVRIAQEAEGRSLRPSEISRYWSREGWRFVLGEPGRSLPLLLHKLRLFWAAGERPNNKQVYFFWEEFRLGRWPLPLVGFWLVGPLGLLGLLTTWRRSAGLRLLAVFTVTYMVGVVAFFVNARFRLPVVPALIVLGAVGTAELVRAVRERGRSAWARVGLAVGLLALVNADRLTYERRTPGTDALSWASVGNAYDGAGRRAEAIEAYERALALHEENRTRPFLEILDRVHFDLGRLAWLEGERERGLSLMERGDRDDPRRTRDKAFLAAAYLELGRREDALAEYAEIAALPGQERYLLGQVRAFREKGMLERAELGLRALIQVRGDPDGSLGAALEQVLRDRDAAGGPGGTGDTGGA